MTYGGTGDGGWETGEDGVTGWTGRRDDVFLLVFVIAWEVSVEVRELGHVAVRHRVSPSPHPHRVPPHRISPSPHLPLTASLLLVQFGKYLSKANELGHVVVNDVRLVGMIHEIVLMIAFGFIEGLERNYLRDDLVWEDFRFV